MGLNRVDRSRHQVQFTATEDIFDSISLDGGTRAPFVAAREWLRCVAFSVASRSEAPGRHGGRLCSASSQRYGTNKKGVATLCGANLSRFGPLPLRPWSRSWESVWSIPSSSRLPRI